MPTRPGDRDEPSTADVSTVPDDPSFWRRVLAFLVDWVIAALVTFLVLPYDLVLDPGRRPAMFLGVPQSSWVVLGVFFLLRAASVGLTGAGVGHRLLGLRVWQVRPGSFLLQAVVRAALSCLFLPGLVRAGDGRLFHDYVAGTRLVRPAASRQNRA